MKRKILLIFILFLILVFILCVFMMKHQTANDMAMQESQETFSYNELNEAKKVIDDNFEQLYESYVNDNDVESPEKELLESIVGYYINEDANRLIVEIKSLDEKKEKTFKELFAFENDSCIKFIDYDYDIAW